MDKALNGLAHVGCILDDIITGVDDTKNLQNLEKVLQRLSDMDIKLNISKCAFMQEEVDYFALRKREFNRQKKNRSCTSGP